VRQRGEFLVNVTQTMHLPRFCIRRRLSPVKLAQRPARQLPIPHPSQCLAPDVIAARGEFGLLRVRLQSGQAGERAVFPCPARYWSKGLDVFDANTHVQTCLLCGFFFTLLFPQRGTALKAHSGVSAVQTKSKGRGPRLAGPCFKRGPSALTVCPIVRIQRGAACRTRKCPSYPGKMSLESSRGL
jgi:hypothetical protein